MTLFNIHSFRSLGQLVAISCIAFLLSSAPVFASPGAHGPNGEHLDAPGQMAGSTGTVPSVEAHSEMFELVGRLQGGELSILINRFATNEPVLNAQVEEESGALKAAVKFHADMGDYAVDDEAMLKLLTTSGEHPIIVTVLAGQDSDLLDGTLKVSGPASQGSDHGHGHDDGHAHGLSRTAWLFGALVFLGAVAWLFGRTRKASTAPSKGGAL